VKKKIWIFQTGEPLQIDKDNMTPMRAIQLSHFLLNLNYKVTLISANFNHFFKKHRKITNKKFINISLNKNFNIVLINSPGYSNNVSLKRLYDHFILALNLRSFLKKNNPPDFAYLGFPPIEPVLLLADWLYKKKVEYTVDVKDLWPEYFYENKKLKKISFLIKIFFVMHEILLNRTFRRAKGIISNNKFFIDYIRNKIKRRKNKYDTTIYLTKPLSLDDKDNDSFLQKIGFKKNNFNFYFCGNINFRIFDFVTLIDAMKYLQNKNYNFKFFIGGYGSLDELKKLKTYINLSKLNFTIKYINYVQYKNHKTMLRNCNAFIAPYFDTFTFSNSFPNKIIECLQFKVPIITSLTGDIGKFLRKYNIGYVYKAGNTKNLIFNLKKIMSNKKKNKINKKNFENKIIFKKFDHEENYSQILKNII
jgi:glycosyltransferase involved in cell wall biosynthesis